MLPHYSNLPSRWETKKELLSLYPKTSIVYELHPWDRRKFGLLTCRLQPIPHLDPWHFSHHLKGEKTSTKHETDHRTDRNSDPAATWSFSEGNGPFPSARPTYSSVVTQVRPTLLADSCQRRLRRLHRARWHPDCENFDTARLQVAPPNNHINGRQWT